MNSAEFTARQSRNRTGQADRNMKDRKIKRHPIFLSLYVPVRLPLQQISPRLANNLDYCSAELARKSQGSIFCFARLPSMSLSLEPGVPASPSGSLGRLT